MIVRSVPGNEIHNNEHLKPFFYQITLLVFHSLSQTKWPDDKYFYRLKKYIDYWLNKMDDDKNGLSELMSLPHTVLDNQYERVG